MKIILFVAVPLLAIFSWALTGLSSDAIGMALGLTLGVVAGLPAAVLVLVASRNRSAPAIDADDYIDVPTVYADEVTPYYRLARRAMGAPALPDRQEQIAELRTYLAHLEASEVSR